MKKRENVNEKIMDRGIGDLIMIISHFFHSLREQQITL